VTSVLDIVTVGSRAMTPALRRDVLDVCSRAYGEDFEPYLRAQGHDGWLDNSFVITELHVHPRHQNRGIGRSLITTITDGATEPRSILSAIDTDSPARGLYHSLGYQDLARQVLFPSAPKPYAVMGAPLPLRRR